MENKINEIKEDINRIILEIIQKEYKYANYAVKLKDKNISFKEVLTEMKELKHSFMKLDKELDKIK